MLDRHPVHRLEMFMNDDHTGRLTARPPLSEKAYDIGVKVLHLRPYLDWLNPDEKATPDRQVTEFNIAVDSQRHLSNRANCLFDGLLEAGVQVELGETVRDRNL